MCVCVCVCISGLHTCCTDALGFLLCGKVFFKQRDHVVACVWKYAREIERKSYTQNPSWAETLHTASLSPLFLFAVGPRSTVHLLPSAHTNRTRFFR